MRTLVRIAYSGFAAGGLSSRHIDVLGGPRWVDTDLYTLVAKAEGNVSVALLTGPMLQTLLEERFRLRAHTESRKASMYELTVVDSSKLRPSREGSCVSVDPDSTPDALARAVERKPVCGFGATKLKEAVWVADWNGATMAELAGRLLAPYLDRPIIDRTGLAGRFDVHLEFARDSFKPGSVLLNGVADEGFVENDAQSARSLFGALRDQLGLKLSPVEGAKDVIVIDHAEQPSEN